MRVKGKDEGARVSEGTACLQGIGRERTQNIKVSKENAHMQQKTNKEIINQDIKL